MLTINNTCISCDNVTNKMGLRCRGTVTCVGCEVERVRCGTEHNIMKHAIFITINRFDETHKHWQHDKCTSKQWWNTADAQLTCAGSQTKSTIIACNHKCNVNATRHIQEAKSCHTKYLYIGCNNQHASSQVVLISETACSCSQIICSGMGQSRAMQQIRNIADWNCYSLLCYDVYVEQL